MATREEIEILLKSIKKRRKSWQLSTRPKNLLTLANLGLDQEVAFDNIYDDLTWHDYISGPEEDNHIPPIPGNIWKFGLNIEDLECYLKFQDRPNGIIIWISIHKAEYPIKYPYK